ncbi:kinesin-like protein KIF22 [Erpetoichthys calabaricus]|uniref:kinesin-like protein KIF22 n=1 Tax=Erpetoichthys calabaricus TaxID=27687 RepID=UPI0022348448|nr:kinesin-like protein KIF22 [Erpetoichthys calabaricus]
MASTVRDLLLQSLSELETSHLRSFRGRLSDHELKNGAKIPRAAIEEAEDRDSLADLLIRYCTEAKAVHVMVAVLKRCCFNNEAEKLLQHAHENRQLQRQKLPVPRAGDSKSSSGNEENSKKEETVPSECPPSLLQDGSEIQNLSLESQASEDQDLLPLDKEVLKRLEEKLLHILNTGTERELKSLQLIGEKKVSLILGGRKMLTQYTKVEDLVTANVISANMIQTFKKVNLIHLYGKEDHLEEFENLKLKD